MQPYRKFTNASSGGVTDHGALTGLTDDDHTQYPLLVGRSGGQTLIGGTASGDDLLLKSTSHATKGRIILEDNASSGIGLDAGTTSQTLKVYAYDTAYWAALHAGPIRSFQTNSTDANFILTGNGSGNYIGIYDGTNDPRILFTRSINAENAHNSGISNPASGVLRITDGSTGTGFLQTAGFKRKTADQTVTDSTTLVDDTHLTVSLAAGRSYKFKFVLFASVRTGNQVKVCLSGTATHTHLISSAKIYDSSTLLMDLVDVVINTTPGNHLYASNTLPTDEALIEIEGTTTVNAAGTFLLQFAEVTAGIGSDVILRRGSTLEVWDVA